MFKSEVWKENRKVGVLKVKGNKFKVKTKDTHLVELLKQAFMKGVVVRSKRQRLATIIDKARMVKADESTLGLVEDLLSENGYLLEGM